MGYLLRDASSLVHCSPSTSYLVPPSRPIGRRRGVETRAAKQATGPPKPNPRFSRADLKRIKQQGPSIDDLMAHHEVQIKDAEGGEATRSFSFVPSEVLGQGAGYAPEPKWGSLPQMPYMEFFQGLRERNWTTQWYDPAAEKWELKFFEDSGRFMRPSFAGYRVLVTKEGGQQCWVNLDEPGAPTFLHDYRSGGSRGGIFKAKRESQDLGYLPQYGSNQVLEQLFQAHEQKLSGRAEEEYYSQGWVDTKADHKYSCPAERHLAVSFHQTPQEFTMHGIYSQLPQFLFYSFGISFLGVALAIGIFRPRKQMPVDMFQAMEFAQSKGNARREGSTGVTFSDVGGLGNTIQDMMKVVEFLKNPKQYSQLDAKPPKGILLEGDPGVGKTLIAKAIAGEARVPFYQMAGSEFVEAIVGVGAARVRDLFARARVNAPCIIFVDEIDALGIKRAEAGVRTNEEREQTLNQLLSEMDGFTPDAGVVFVAATNRADLLDPALMRAGRFDRKITILRPNEQGRTEVLKIHARRHRLGPDVDLEQLAKDLPGLSGAELGNVLNEAALSAVRRGGQEIIQSDVYTAVDRVVQGIRRPSLPDQFAVKRIMATHEVGNALMATLLHRQHKRIEAVERVSLVPRGSEWSRTIYARGRDEDYLIMTRGRLLDRIRVMLAGRAAEEVVQGTPSSYSNGDLSDATQLAVRVVSNYGMSGLGITSYAPMIGRSGPPKGNFEVSVDSIDADLFGSSLQGGSFQPSDESRHRMRAEVQQLLVNAYNSNLQDLSAHRAALDAATDALLKEELLTGPELESILDSHPPVEPGEGEVQLVDPLDLAAMVPAMAGTP
ncbi:hypothetical protein D9Q98_005083 [Chlorella vulgaris]|uniref:AAA+ ATPase domain-containing protein n=1 Tax=Chlorella vulgaris TaxID=3077 RepID=A0A9D4TNS2_CHLVU|nr:hypothetical protein D9Q98_005083 [Chlorella vulgaris]